MAELFKVENYFQPVFYLGKVFIAGMRMADAQQQGDRQLELV